MKLAVQECGRKLGTYLRRRQRMRRDAEKRDVFERYIGEISRSCNAITGADMDELYDALMKQAQRRTEIADAVLDDEGKIVGYKNERNGLEKDEGVVIVSREGGEAVEAPKAAQAAEAKPAKRVSAKPAKKTVKKKVVRKKVKKKRTAAAGLFER